MRDVYVLGIGQTAFGKQPQYLATQLGAQAAKIALKDAGVKPSVIQVAYASRVMGALQTAEEIYKQVGIAGIEMHNVENACASGSSAVHQLYKDIACGVYDIGIATGCESMSNDGSKGVLSIPGDDLNSLMGVSMPALGAFSGNRLMYTMGAEIADLAYPSIKNHRHAVNNPFAQYRKELTLEDILNSRMICDPIRTLMCCPNSDGAASVILCSENILKQYTTKRIRIASSVLQSADYEDPESDLSDIRMIGTLCKKAYELSGISPKDIDLVELHDAFSPEEIYAYEAMGMAPEGESLRFLRDGQADYGGSCVFSPSGGLQSLGHPLGASGIRVVCEIAAHLRGDAGVRQVKGAKAGLAQMIGGYATMLGSPSVGGTQILTN